MKQWRGTKPDEHNGWKRANTSLRTKKLIESGDLVHWCIVMGEKTAATFLVLGSGSYSCPQARQKTQMLLSRNHFITWNKCSLNNAHEVKQMNKHCSDSWHRKRSSFNLCTLCNLVNALYWNNRTLSSIIIESEKLCSSEPSLWCPSKV